MMRVLRVDSGDASYVDDEIVEDVLFNILINGVPVSQMMVYEQYLEELVIGHLRTSNIIHGLDEIQEVRIEDNSAYVKLTHDFHNELNREQRTMVLEQASRGQEVLSVPENIGLPYVDPLSIFDVMSELNQRGEVFRSTGGTHSALMVQSGKESLFVEDVGRFNAVDKAVGLALASGFDLSESMLATSGRLAGEMVLKAAFAGVPIMCSISAPFCTGVRIAQASEMTLIGFARHQRFNVYSGFRRLSA